MGNAIRLNLGCGFRHLDGYVNIDNRQECKPDLWRDITLGLPFFNDNTVDEARAVDLLEHIPIGKVVPLIEDIYRMLKPEGIFYSVTPSTDGRGAFQDPTHVSFWNINSWLYYVDDAHRELYGIKAKFRGKLWDEPTGSPQMRIIHTIADLRKA